MNFVAGEVIQSQVQFVTTGPIDLHTGQPDAFVVLEDEDLMLQEDLDGILLEDTALDWDYVIGLGSMADLRISQLPPLTGAILQADDALPIVDGSASETKKITSKDLVQSGIALIDDGQHPQRKDQLHSSRWVYRDN